VATWQFTIALIPTLWAEEHGFNCSDLYDVEGYDTAIAWAENQPTEGFEALLSKILPESKSWSNNLLCWGDEKSNDIQVWHEDNKVEEIHVRLDLNQNLNEFIGKLVDLANSLNCSFFYPELRYISKASEYEVKTALQKSDALKFVKDPHEFLKGLSHEA